MGLTTSVFAATKTNMNLEGSCKGKMHDNSAISFTYYSDFDGCKAKSNAGITIAGSLSTGDRSFTETQDIYQFKATRLTFANSTGNVSGKFTYKDQNAKSHTIVVTCEIRNYEYAPCE